jgi:hypothetical protein
MEDFVMAKAQYQFTRTYKTRERAEESMNDSYADGEIGYLQNPTVKAIKNHRGKIQGYAVFLDC